MDLTFPHIIEVARRRWWLLVLVPLIAGVVAFAVAKGQQPSYSAAVIIKVNPPLGTGADLGALQVTQNLTETYRRTMVMTPVLDRVVKDLHLPYSGEDLADKCTATAIRNTQLIQLAVADHDPVTAARIANAIAATFIANLNAETSTQISATESDLDTETTKIEQQLASVNAQIRSLETGPDSNTPSVQSQLSDLRAQSAQLQQQRSSLATQAQTASSTLASTRTQVTVAQPAVPPRHPFAPNVLLIVLLSIFTAVPFGVGVVASMELLNTSVRGSADAAALTGAPIFAEVGTIPKLGPGSDRLFVLAAPRSREAEAIRMLRANLQFAAAVEPTAVLVITSADAEDGKSTVAANLGIVMAQSGLATVVVDADLRRPSQHKIFDIPNDRGLTTLLTHPNYAWGVASVRAGAPGLTVIPSGPLPPNPADLLSIDAMSDLLAQLRGAFDIVLIDTPPVLAVSDPMVVGDRADGAILVTRSRQTRRDRLQRAAEYLKRANVRLVGMVIQQSEPEMSYYAYGERSLS